MQAVQGEAKAGYEYTQCDGVQILHGSMCSESLEGCVVVTIEPVDNQKPMIKAKHQSSIQRDRCE